METLKGCFFFCADNVVEKKDVVVYPNNKPYITKDIKECIHYIKKKKLAFRNRDNVGLLVAQKSLKYKSKGTAQAMNGTQFLYL